MPLQLFPFLQDNTRLIRFKDTLYKVKVKYKLDTFPSRGVIISEKEAHNQIEQVFRAVMYINERDQTLKTIATPNFLIKPFKIPWSFPQKCSDYTFQQNGKSLKVFDHMFEFHISNIEDRSRNRTNKEVVSDINDTQGNNAIQRNLGKVACRPAVVMISDINSAGPARFGRTKDGQLYRVCTSSVETNQKVTNYNKDENVNVVITESARFRENDTATLVDKSKFKDTKSRNDESVKVKSKNEQEFIMHHRKSQDTSNKCTGASYKKVSQKDKKEDDNVVRRKASRDKHSLRKSELLALDFENVQESRLRRKKTSFERVFSRNIRDRTREMKDSQHFRERKDETKNTDNVTRSESSLSETEISEVENVNDKTQRTFIRTRYGGRKTLKISRNKRKHNALKMRKGVVSNKKRKFERADSDSEVDDIVNKVGRMLCRSGELNKSNNSLTSSGSKIKSSPRQSSSSMVSSGSENRCSSRKPCTSNKKRKVEVSERRSDEETNSVSTSQESGRSRKVKLYHSKHSPQVITHQETKKTVEICTPLVSTVLPQQRNQGPPETNMTKRSSPRLTSYRLTRQSLINSEDVQKAKFQVEGPSQVYTDMMSHKQARSFKEQIENAEADKSRQLNELNMPRRSPRLNFGSQEAKQRRSSGLWGKIMESLITPTKRYMFGSKK